MRERYERQSFLGADSDKIFANLTVGLVGGGGGGSHLAQQLAHLGVGRFLLIDPDRVEETNLNRLVGATARDAERHCRKALVIRRLIRGINPNTRIRTVTKKWQECHELLRGCDVIFGSVDTYRDRYELEVAARRYMIPYLDLGMDVHTVNDGFSVSGQVILSVPGGPCMRCLGFIREELLKKEAENYGAAGGRPQVVWANGLLASSAVGVFTALFTPWQKQPPPGYLEYEGDSQTISISRRFELMKDKQCPHFPDCRDLGDPFWIPRRFRLSPGRP